MKHATALAAVLGVAAASAIPPMAPNTDTCAGIDGCVSKQAEDNKPKEPKHYWEGFDFNQGIPVGIGRRAPSPRGGRPKPGGTPGPGSPPPPQNGGGSNAGQDAAVEIGSGLITEGFGVGLDQLVNGQQPPPAPPQKRDPKGGRPKPGPGSPPPPPKDNGGGDSQAAKDLALGVGEGLITEGFGVGLDALVNGQQPPPPPAEPAPAPQKRDPRRRPNKPGPSSPPPPKDNGGGGSQAAKDLGLGVAEGVITEGLGIGLDALVNGQQPPPPPAEPAPAPQKRDPRRRPNNGPGSPPPPKDGGGGGSQAAKDLAVGVGEGLITEGLGVGLDALVNGQPAPAPPAPQKRDPEGPGLVDQLRMGYPGVGLPVIPPALKNVPQKRDPIIGALAGLIPGLIDAGTAVAGQKRSGYAVEAYGNPEKREPVFDPLLGLIPDLIGADTAAAGAAGQKRSENAVEAYGNPEKREPVFGPLLGLIPDLIGAGTAAAGQKRSEDVVEVRASKGKSLGKKLGAAMVDDKDKESSASASLGRPGMAGYLTAGLAVAVVVFGVNAL